MRYKDVCKRDLKGAGIEFRELEGSVEDRLSRKQAVSAGVAAAEDTRAVEALARRSRKRVQQEPQTHVPTHYICQVRG